MSDTNFVDQVTVIEAAWLNDVNDHVYNVTTTDVHPASAITNTPAGTLAATTVQAALNELDTEKATTASVVTAQATADNHITDTTAAHAASAIANTPAGNIAATDVQAAINELDTEKISSSQVQSGTFVNISAALTGTEYAAAPSPAISAYTAGQRFMVTFDLACPAAPTLKLNGLASPPSLVRQNLNGSYETLNVNDFPAGWKSAVVLVSATQALVEILPRTWKLLSGLTRDLTVASGSVAYTGCGATPKYIRILGGISSTLIWSDGTATESTDSCVYTNDVGNIAITAASCAGFASSAGNRQTATASFSKDTVTLAWTKTGTPTGTAAFNIEVEY